MAPATRRFPRRRMRRHGLAAVAVGRHAFHLVVERAHQTFASDEPVGPVFPAEAARIGALTAAKAVPSRRSIRGVRRAAGAPPLGARQGGATVIGAPPVVTLPPDAPPRRQRPGQEGVPGTVEAKVLAPEPKVLWVGRGGLVQTGHPVRRHALPANVPVACQVRQAFAGRLGPQPPLPCSAPERPVVAPAPDHRVAAVLPVLAFADGVVVNAGRQTNGRIGAVAIPIQGT